MKEYHYIDASGQQCGPFSSYELKNHPVSKTTLVWTPGMADWLEAQTVAELNFLFDAAVAQPSVNEPPTYQTNTSQSYQQSTQYNPYGNNQRGVLDGSMPIPKNWLVESILVTVLCCLPFGIAGILSANKVEGFYHSGNYEAALRASKDAKKWVAVGFFSSIMFWVLYALFHVVVIGVAMSGSF